MKRDESRYMRTAANLLRTRLSLSTATSAPTPAICSVASGRQAAASSRGPTVLSCEQCAPALLSSLMRYR